jgi:hypothetical protein
MTKQRFKGYLLPDIMPTGYRCYQVIVPDCEEAIAALMGSLEFLSKWMAWERDTAHRGRDMANLFWNAMQATRDLVEEGCDMIMLRQHPTEPCRLQYSDDGGLTWNDWADIALCPVWPDAPSDDSEALSADILWALWNIVQVIVDALDVGAGAAQAAQEGAEEASRLMGMPNYRVWHVVAVAMAEHSPAERAAAMDYDEWEPLHAAGYCQVETLPPEDDYRHWLDVWADSIYDWLNNAADWLWAALAATWGNLSGTAALANAGFGGNGGGANFGWGTPVCGWYHSWDFTANDGDWETCGAFSGGAWVTGLGWVWTDGQDTGGSWRRGISVCRTFDECTITKVRLTYNMTQGVPVPPDTSDKPIRIFVPDTTLQRYITYDELEDGVGLTFAWVGAGVSAESIRAVVVCDFDAYTQSRLTGGCYLTRCEVWGTGDNPFV